MNVRPCRKDYTSRWFLWYRVHVAVLSLILLSIGFRISIDDTAWVAPHRTAYAAVTAIHVNASVIGGDNDGTSWANAYTDLQTAITAASSGDEIWVAAGTYKPTSGTDRKATFTLNDGVKIYGGFPTDDDAATMDDRDWEANVTILSGEIGTPNNVSDNSYHVVTGATDATNAAVLDGFTITKGIANGGHGDNRGGGMVNINSSPTLTNITFSENEAQYGGGMYTEESSPTLNNVTFSSNSVTYEGGGMSNGKCTITLTNVTFKNNWAGTKGGGMHNFQSSSTLTNVTFSGNSASEKGGGMSNSKSSSTLTNVTFSYNSAGSYGGGMSNSESSSTLTNVTFSYNSADDSMSSGGGMSNETTSNSTLTNVTFNGNSAGSSGGGMYNFSSDPVLTNVTFSDNSAEYFGGGMFNASNSPMLTNVTFGRNSVTSDNGGGAMYNGTSKPTLVNCILWGNFISGEEVGVPNQFNDTSATVTYSIVQGDELYAGTGNSNEDPLLTSDLHLQSGSPAIGAGNNDALIESQVDHDLNGDGDKEDTITTDLDGAPRITNTTVDMGAYEWRSYIYVDTDATGDNDGSSWDDAYTELSVGLRAAHGGSEVWVAAGTYKPSTYGLSSDSYEATFTLKEGVEVYGGFAGGENERDARDWETNVTTMSGDLNGDDYPEDDDTLVDNSYHVVTGEEDATSAAVLDGFTITAGNALGNGGGMINMLSSPTLTNLIFSGNRARFDGGGGMANLESSPTLTNVTFSDNSAVNGGNGGGMYNNSSSPTLTNVTFSDNSADEGYGGGMYNKTTSSPTLTNVTFSGNSAGEGGGMANEEESYPTLTNVTFSDNSAVANDEGNGGYGGGMYNYESSSPTLTNVTFSDNSAVANDKGNGGYGGGMYNEFSNPTLTNVTFNGNSADDGGGGGMYNYESSPTLANVTFSDNSAAEGGGMYNEVNSSPTLTNVTFGGNSADSGGGMFNLSSDPVLTNVTFSGNSADSSGGVGGGMFNYESSPTLTNVTFGGNSADSSGGAMYNQESSNPTLTNVTFGGNSADDGGGMYNESSNPTLVNSILWGNTPNQFNDDTSATVTYSIVQGVDDEVYDGDSNSNADPLFVRNPDPGEDATWDGVDDDYGDLHLKADSPAIGAGSNIALNEIDVDHDLNGDGDKEDTINTDLDGAPRITNTTVDMGAYEWRSRIYVDASKTSGKNDGSSWDDAYTELSVGLRAAHGGSEVWVAKGTYTPSTYGLSSDPRDATFTLNEDVAVYGGFAGGEPERDDRNWETNVTTMSGDLNGDDDPEDDDTLADNSYHVVTGASGATSDAVLDGFTITGGNAGSADANSISGGGMVNDNYSSPTLTNVTFSGNSALFYGGGMYNKNNSSPSLTNVTFSGNSAKDGGGMYNENNSSPSLTNITFSGNSATDGSGGGMYNFDRSSPLLTNVTFSGNSATSGGGGMRSSFTSNPTLINVTFSSNNASSGGGMYNGSSSTLTNVTFSGNSAKNNGGGMYNSNSSSTLTNVTFSGNSATTSGGGMYNKTQSRPTLTNCILWGNTVNGTANQIVDDTSADGGGATTSTTVTYSIVEGGYTGEGNLDADPLFVDADGADNTVGTSDDELRLQKCSPAVDVGNNDKVPTGVNTDLDGNTRKVDGDDNGTATVDMGAYELQTARKYGTLAFSAATLSGNEGNSNASTVIGTITRTGGSDCAVSVDVALGSSTATSDDFTHSLPQTINFADGDTGNKTVSVSMVGDTTYEGNETIVLNLSNVQKATLGTVANTTYTITNDDAPAVTINNDSKPANPTNKTSASFEFTGPTDAGGVKRYECQLDSGDWTACTSPQAYTGLSAAEHTFKVRAVASSGTEGTAASHTWTVDTTAPSAPTVSGTTPTNDTTPTWTWTKGGGGSGTYRYQLNSESGTWSAETTATSYTPSTTQSAGTHTLYVQERDAAGNWSVSGSKAIVIETTAQPSTTTTAQPSTTTTAQPSTTTTAQPSTTTTVQPSTTTTVQPSTTTTAQPSTTTTAQPSTTTTAQPTGTTTITPTTTVTATTTTTAQPSTTTTAQPSTTTTAQPSTTTTAQPSTTTTAQPSTTTTVQPTGTTTITPTTTVTPEPTGTPTAQPTGTVTPEPTDPDTKQTPITPEEGGTITTTTGMEIIFPVGAVDNTIIVTLTMQQLPSQAVPTGTVGLSSFTAIAVRQADGTPVTTFAKPLTIKIPYTDEDVAKITAQGLTENDMKIAFWNGTAWETLPSTVDTVNKVVIATVDHFTEFILLAQEAEVTSDKRLIFLPYVLR